MAKKPVSDQDAMNQILDGINKDPFWKKNQALSKSRGNPVYDVSSQVTSMKKIVPKLNKNGKKIVPKGGR